MAERCAERNRVKKLIRTVLKPAAANGIHIDQMNNIYEVMIGKTIPFRKFGFQSLEDFLKNSPDICRVVREIRGLVLYPRIIRETARVTSLVARQREIQRSRDTKK